MKRTLSISFSMLILLIFCGSAYATNFTMTITDVSDLDISSFYLAYDVSYDFNITNFSLGDAVPSEYSFLGWQTNKAETSDAYGSYELQIDASDFDALFGVGHPLTDGILFTFDYEGSLGPITFKELISDASVTNLFDSGEFEVITLSTTSGIIQATAVPESSSFLLLFTGLCSLAGLAIRQR